MENTQQKINETVKSNNVVLFMKGTKAAPQCGFSNKVSGILNYMGVDFKDINVLGDESIREGIKIYSDWPTVPQLYVNGELKDTETGAGFMDITASEIRIGASAGANNYYNGKVDEVRIWNTPLSQIEIQEWMSKKVTTSHPQVGDLLSYYRYDENTGTIAYDLIYNPEETLFMKNAKKYGAIVTNGLEMLELQAERAWKLFNLEE